MYVGGVQVEVASQNGEEDQLFAFNQAGIAGWILWYLSSIIVYTYLCSCVGVRIYVRVSVYRYRVYERGIGMQIDR